MNGAPVATSGLLERYFRLAENNTTVRREMLGGLTTFMTMAYLIVVNPRMLALPAFVVILAMPLTFSIATGL